MRRRMKRRDFIKTGIGAGMAGIAAGCRTGQKTVDYPQLDQALQKPLLHFESLTHPVTVESIELLKYRGVHFLCARSSEGHFGISVPNGKIEHLYPILFHLVVPYFIGKDARTLESLIEGVYVYQSNYKMSSLALWCPVAWVEFALLDLLGRAVNRHVSDLFGGQVRSEIPIYVASGNRDTTAEKEVNILKKLIQETGAKAVKFKVGGRMSKDADSMAGRSERLIELSRKELGSGVAIQADANGSYGVSKAVEIGKRLEAIDAHLFEEPCPFDWLDETKRVADTLDIFVSGGEQESSEHRFRWMVRNRAVQVVQPDLHYYGGFIRSTRVARMAAEAGMAVTPHISGGDIGYADMANFCSYTPNIGRFHEFKGGTEKTGDLFDPPLRVRDGMLNVPKGPGMGIARAEEMLRKAKKLY